MADSQYQPPPGQGYQPSAPGPNSYDEPRQHYDERDRYGPPGGHPGPQDSRVTFDTHDSPRHAHARQGHGGGPDGYQYPPSQVGSDRPYAPSEPRPNEGNMIAPYDEEKAYAEYCDAYGPPPPSAYGYDYDTRSQRHQAPSEYSRGYSDRPRYDERDRSYSDRSRYDSRERRYSPRRDSRDRRYDDRYDERERARFARRPSKQGGKDFLGQGDGERGLASAILGGAAGAFIGHKAGKGALGTLGGLAVGAIGANAIEKHVEKREEKEKERPPRRRHYDSYDSDPYYRGRSSSRYD